MVKVRNALYGGGEFIAYDSVTPLTWTIIDDTGAGTIVTSYPASVLATSQSGSSETKEIESNETFNLSLYNTLIIDVGLRLDEDNTGSDRFGFPSTLLNFTSERDTTEFNYKFVFDISALNGTAEKLRIRANANGVGSFSPTSKITLNSVKLLSQKLV